MSRIYYRGAKAAIVCYGKKGFGLFLKQEGESARLALQNSPSPLLASCVPHQDLTDSSSFERAKFWVKELRNLEEVGGLTSPEDQAGAGGLVAQGG